MDASSNLCSVVILSYRNLDGIYDTLDSIFIQTYPAIEVVISDDGTSEFETEKNRLEQHINDNARDNITNVVIRHASQNQGTVKNINEGIMASAGIYVKVLAAEDCLAREDALSEYVSFLDEHECEICFAKMRGVTKDGEFKDHLMACEDDYELLSSMSPPEMEERLFARNFLPAPAWCAKRSLFEKYGYFPECARLIEDYPYWLHLSHEGAAFGFIDKVLVLYKLSGVSSAGHYSEAFMTDMFAIYDRFIFPNDHRYGVLQPLYNSLKRGGLNYYMAIARWGSYSRCKKMLLRLKYAPFRLYTYVQEITAR